MLELVSKHSRTDFKNEETAYRLALRLPFPGIRKERLRVDTL